jgi:hypothetical protein
MNDIDRFELEMERRLDRALLKDEDQEDGIKPVWDGCLNLTKISSKELVPRDNVSKHHTHPLLQGGSQLRW